MMGVETPDVHLTMFLLDHATMAQSAILGCVRTNMDLVVCKIIILRCLEMAKTVGLVDEGVAKIIRVMVDTEERVL